MELAAYDTHDKLKKTRVRSLEYLKKLGMKAKVLNIGRRIFLKRFPAFEWNFAFELKV